MREVEVPHKVGAKGDRFGTAKSKPYAAHREDCMIYSLVTFVVMRRDKISSIESGVCNKRLKLTAPSHSNGTKQL